jgi:type IV secretion system protein VirB1
MVYAEFVSLAQQCAPTVHYSTMAAVASVESGYNPYAIGVVKGQLVRQPVNKAEAIATAKMLEQAGYNFSMGVGQVNRYNLPKFNLTYETVFDACENLHAASLILKDCFERAKSKFPNEQDALQASFSCYYSGNFSTGFSQDFEGQPSYVQKILNSAGHGGVAPIAVVRQGKTTRKKIASQVDETAAAMVFK